MLFVRQKPADSLTQLRDRVNRFFSAQNQASSDFQLELGLVEPNEIYEEISTPLSGATEFLNFLADALPTCELYIFGGVLRDFALFGRRGFSSDIDLVVEGDWQDCVSYLGANGAKLNKFGGYRIQVAGQPIDIWNARETWAIRHGYVEYKNISSLLNTTILNWDAILMDWRTKAFICNGNYLKNLQERTMDVVLEANPNPLGAAVRIFRHLCLKDATRITPRAAELMESYANRFLFEELVDSEIRSYRNTVIEKAVYSFFKEMNSFDDPSVKVRFNRNSSFSSSRGLALSFIQQSISFK
jgi:predicted nucleotidyltransferase